MSTIRITKEFSFEMAHALWNYDGACSNIHGHSYKLFVTLKGKIFNEKNHPKNGMVADFGDLKTLVKETIVKEFDHSLVLSSDSDFEKLIENKQMFQNLKILNFQPSCENLLLYFAEILKSRLPDNLHLYSLKLKETQTSFAEWFAEDN